MSISSVLDTIGNMAANHGLQTAFGVAVGAVGGKLIHEWHLARSKNHINKGLMGFDKVLVQEVRFDPSGVMNPTTGKEYYDQKIRTISDREHVAEIFNPTIRHAMLDYLTKAIKHCTQDEPVVQQHLHKVLPNDPEKRHAVLDHFEGDWANRFSTLLLERSGCLSFGLFNREVPEEVDLPVLLTYNPEAKRKQLRIFIFPRNQTVPAPENVRFRIDEEFEAVSRHVVLPEWQKYELFKAIHKALEGGGDWESWRYKVAVPTGRSKAIAAPQPIGDAHREPAGA